MELREALTEIASIRRQIAAAEKFRGYRALPVASGGALALIAAVAQTAILPEPSSDLGGYVGWWIVVAALAGAIPVGDVLQRQAGRNSLRATLIRLACEQFAPCVAAGALLTWVIVVSAPSVGWMLPGLWSVLFSLGLFASCRLLPASTFAVAVWYLLGGCVVLAIGPERGGLRPWTMATLFGIGQLAAAAALSRQDSEDSADGR
jgi:hypothetical protein